MLFEINENKLKQAKFLSLNDLSKIEKDLENILSINMFDTLFEDSPLFTIFQERAWQPEPDIVALDQDGNTVIFELKRNIASDDALGQLFRYVQKVQKWDYETLENKYHNYLIKKYSNRKVNEELSELKKVHQESFGNPKPLEAHEFNRHQRLVVVGHSADVQLISAIDYWKRKGLDVDFIPYRFYEIAGKIYFEFFAKPYDIRSNPAIPKGVIFDTNRTYYSNGLRDMMEVPKVSSYGEIKELVKMFNKRDIVFYSHRWVGIVGAARVKSTKLYENTNLEEMFYKVELLTPPPEDLLNPPALRFAEVSSILIKSFFWARTDKRPYLSIDESEELLNDLQKRLSKH